MENENFIENIATRLGQNATVKNVYGDPIMANGKTIIPVAQISLGFGGGFGKNKKKKQALQNVSQEAMENEKPDGGEGAGGGGGMRAIPKGVYEISDLQTKFIPVSNTKQLFFAALCGFLIHKWVFGRRC